ncbi:MAG TPA: class I SAM-dependent methyltransferase [Luteitalea sp.]|nr:class I SAM-dependent methyltransferase [Luteitalea sp.]
MAIETVSCRLCGCESRAILHNRPDYEYGHATRLDYYRCAGAACGFIFAAPIPLEQIASFYQAYSTHVAPAAPGAESRVRRLEALVTPPPIRRELANYLGDGIPQRPELRLLDFGCGNASLLKRLQARGFTSLHGFDFDPKARDAARAQGLVIFDQVEQVFAQGNTFDLIVLNHVIEHLDDPVGTLSQLMGTLAPGGRVYLRTPNTGSFLRRLFGSRWRGYETPRHLGLFNLRSIRQLARRIGDVDVDPWTENGIFGGVFYGSFTGAFWTGGPGRIVRYALYPLAAWLAVALNAATRSVGEELVATLTTSPSARR